MRNNNLQYCIECDKAIYLDPEKFATLEQYQDCDEKDLCVECYFDKNT